MDREPTYATALLPPERLEVLDDLLASIEVTLTLLRFAPGDARGAIPWSPVRSPAYCRQVAAALELYGSEVDDDGDSIDSGQAHAVLTAEPPLLDCLHAQCDRLRRVLALSEEVLAAVGGDVMALALDRHLALERAGRAHRIDPWWRSDE